MRLPVADLPVQEEPHPPLIAPLIRPLLHEAAGIGRLPEQAEILEAAALVHDIGIKPAMEQFGKCDGRLQEKLGPARAEDILKEVGFSQEVVHRVSFLVGHHHTYTNIDGMDYQILVEADFLVNFYEDEMKTETIRTTVEKVFRSKTGREIAENMFFPKPFQKSETWAQDALQDLEDFIEEQGIYIRQ